MGVGHANKELAHAAGDVNHAGSRRKPQKLDELREFLLACGIAHHMPAVRNIKELHVPSVIPLSPNVAAQDASERELSCGESCGDMFVMSKVPYRQ